MTIGEKFRFRCAIPPAGWWCSREHGHEGPCAASVIPGRNLKPVHISSPTYTEYNACFGLYKEQREIAEKWMREHDEAKHIKPVSEGGHGFRYDGAIGGGYTWCFTSTSIGQVVRLECACGESLDVSDYDSW